MFLYKIHDTNILIINVNMDLRKRNLDMIYLMVLFDHLKVEIVANLILAKLRVKRDH